MLAASRDPSVIELLWPVLVAGSFGVVGVLLGKTFERQHGHDTWRRNERLAAYVALLDESHAFWRHTQLMTPPSADLHGLLEGLNERRMALRRALSRVMVVGPRRMWEPAEAFHDAHSGVSDLVCNAAIPRPILLSKTSAGMALANAEETYTTAAHDILGTG